MPGAETMGMQAFAIDLQFLVHASYIFAAAAFLVREILWLRCLAVLASLCIAATAFLAPDGPLWGTIAWDIAFIAINTGHILYLIYERTRLRLSDDEGSLKATTFAALGVLLTLRLLRRGTWRDYPAGAVLATQGEPLSRLRAVSSGEAAVKAEGRGEIARIRQGHFIGEIAFLTGASATATVIAATPLRCIEWDGGALAGLLERNSELRAGLYAAMGADLAAKIAGQNRAWGAAELAGPPSAVIDSPATS